MLGFGKTDLIEIMTEAGQMSQTPRALRRVATFLLAALCAFAVPDGAAAQSSDIPGWLARHVGPGEGQIAPVVLQRARALYMKKRQQGRVRNPCYLAMDATRPSTASNGAPRKRFYTICESQGLFRASSSGYGNGRNLARANFANGRDCARHFSNAEGSKLTMGGAYTTAETRTSFKGYYKQGGKIRPFNRTFLLFDGEGETRNARERAIGGHQAMFLRWQCKMKLPQSRHADAEGFVPFGRLVDYTSGRSNGCTTWSAEESQQVLARVTGKPTTLYIYPEGRDIAAVRRALQNGSAATPGAPYWNAQCLKKIGAPRFWPKRELQPIINQWRRSLPKNPPLDLPLCK